MLYGPPLVVRLRPAIVVVVSGPLDAGGFLGFFCAFGGLLGVLRSLFAHGTSLSARSSTFLLLVVPVTRRRHARDEAGARGRHKEGSDRARGDGGRPKAPYAKKVAHQAERYPYGPGREVHARAQDCEDDASRAKEQTHEAADPAQEQL